MKNLAWICLLIFFSILSSCGTSQTEQQEATEDIQEEITPSPSEKTEQDVTEHSFSEDYHFNIKEKLFYHLREKVLDIDENTFVKFESLDLYNDEFEYRAVLIDVSMMYPLTSNNNKKAKIIRASHYRGLSNDTQADSISIKGSLLFSNTTSEDLKLRSELRMKMTAKMNTSTMEYDAYAYGGYERRMNIDFIEQDIVVDLVEPKKYNRSDIFLLARIKELTKEDLAGYGQSELAYIRNEIFARHGHAFKTEKMQSHFRAQDWYTAYYVDATEFLNDTERKNAFFIKSLEG